MHDLSNDELQTTQNHSCTVCNAICMSNVCLWYRKIGLPMSQTHELCRTHRQNVTVCERRVQGLFIAATFKLVKLYLTK